MFILTPMLKMVARIATFLLYLLTLLSAYGGKFNPEYFTIPALLTLLMPYLAILSLTVAIIWLLRGGLVTGGLGIAMLICALAPIRTAIPLSFPSKAEEGERTFTLLTFNSLHLLDIKGTESDRNRAVDFLIGCGADVICLQELINWNDRKEIPLLPQSQLDSLLRVYPYQADSKYSDLKVLSKYPVEYIPPTDPYRGYYYHRYLHYRLTIDGEKVDLINIHLTSYSLTEEERKVLTDIHSPSSAKNSLNEFKNSIFSKLKSSFRWRAENVDSIISYTSDMKGPLIVCGDFNDVASSWSYRKMVKAGFKDAYAATNFWPTYTYNSHLFLFHIDQVFCRGPIRPLDVDRLSHDTSDHYPLFCKFALEPVSASPPRRHLPR